MIPGRCHDRGLSIGGWGRGRSWPASAGGERDTGSTLTSSSTEAARRTSRGRNGAAAGAGARSAGRLKAFRRAVSSWSSRTRFNRVRGDGGSGRRVASPYHRRQSKEGHTGDALASSADEGRGTLRKALGSRVQAQDPTISEWGNPARSTRVTRKGGNPAN